MEGSQHIAMWLRHYPSMTGRPKQEDYAHIAHNGTVGVVAVVECVAHQVTQHFTMTSGAVDSRLKPSGPGIEGHAARRSSCSTVDEFMTQLIGPDVRARRIGRCARHIGEHEVAIILAGLVLELLTVHRLVAPLVLIVVPCAHLLVAFAVKVFLRGLMLHPLVILHLALNGQQVATHTV